MVDFNLQLHYQDVSVSIWNLATRDKLKCVRAKNNFSNTPKFYCYLIIISDYNHDITINAAISCYALNLILVSTRNHTHTHTRKLL